MAAYDTFMYAAPAPGIAPRVSPHQETKEEDMNDTTVTIARVCANGLHNFCKETRATCACPSCHYGPCVRCSADNLLVMYDDGTLCASCKRDDAKLANATYKQKCDRCSAVGGFLNPANKTVGYLCTECHAACGHPIELTPSVARLVAPCKGANIDDERHVWVHVRGSRFRCFCGADKYDAALRAKRTRELENELF